MSSERPTPRDSEGGDEYPDRTWAELWASLPAPEATPDLDGADPKTRETVAWLREAWANLAPPTAFDSAELDAPLDRTRDLAGTSHVPRPTGTRVTPGPRRRRLPRVLGWAALFLVFLGAASVLQRSLRNTERAGSPPDPSTEVAGVDRGPADPGPHGNRPGDSPRTDAETHGSGAHATEPGDIPPVDPLPRPTARLDQAGNIELAHGSVRLVLLGN